MTVETLFTPIKLGNQELRHRVVLAPLTRLRNTADFIPTSIVKEYYEQRSLENGLLISERTLISPLAGGLPHAPGIFNKEQIKAWKQVTDAVHKKKGIIYFQLWYMGRAGMRQNNPNQEQIVSASAIRIKGKDFIGNEFQVPRALEIDEIEVLVNVFCQAALNAIEAGFDGVEVHTVNGHLLDQFINSSSNVRTDLYGGSIQNRARFPLQVLDAVVDTVGPEHTGIRFSPGYSFQDMYDNTVRIHAGNGSIVL